MNGQRQHDNDLGVRAMRVGSRSLYVYYAVIDYYAFKRGV